MNLKLIEEGNDPGDKDFRFKVLGGITAVYLFVMLVSGNIVGPSMTFVMGVLLVVT